MVVSLARSDSSQGAEEYYIFSKGKYRIGRKDGDIVFDDQTVSRIHADIVVEKLNSNVRVVNMSKLGTSVKKALGSKLIKLSPKGCNEAILDDGDLLTFGNVTLRFMFVPLTVCIHSENVDQSTQASILTIGAQASNILSPECTHVLVDNSSLVTPDIIEAVLAKKPIVLADWFKMLAAKNIHSEVPSYIPYIPSLTLDGISVRIVDPSSREKCLKGFEFVLGSSYKYIFGDKFQSLLYAAGGKTISADEFSSNSQTSADGESNCVLVVPEKSSSELKLSQELSSLPRITDFKLVAAFLSGHLDSSFMEMPAVVVSSSCSTDGTIVADSDVEIDTARSDRVASDANTRDVVKEICEVQEAQIVEDDEDASRNQEIVQIREIPDSSSDKSRLTRPDVDAVGSIKKIDKCGETLADTHENSDIIFSQDLIVRRIIIPIPDQYTKTKQIDFKCFRKREMVSGNSFKDLIPFSRDPYNESDCGSERSKHIREDNKRKKL